MAYKHKFNRALIEKYSKPVPRYTSFPTAVHFDKSVSHRTAKHWVDDLKPDTALSIYIHIPYCDRLCWFCGCHTKHTLKYEPVARYIDQLICEIKILHTHINRRQRVAEIHLGGGSPSILKAQELGKLRDALDAAFCIGPETEISVEFDPSDLTSAALQPFADFGVTRASIGVQDFDETVQTAINRPQTFAQTASIVETLRNLGVNSLNIDALYGLPHQNLDTMESTLEHVFKLDPNRVALFGYAHVPWMKTHQRLIPEKALPDIYDRFWQAQLAEQMMHEAGYHSIGLDHFAKPDDKLAIDYAQGKVRRNFQGYTTDTNPVLIGLGVSSISRFSGGYTQNVKDIHSYGRALLRGELPIERGVTFAGQNMAFGAAIEELMTYFSLTPEKLRQEFGALAKPVLEAAREVEKSDADELFVKTRNGFRITPKGRPFVRSIAAQFDPYMAPTENCYSQAI